MNQLKMKRSIINLIFVFITGILIGQNSKPSFEIISINQNQTENFIKASAYIESVLEDRGLIIFNKIESVNKLQSDFSFTVCINNKNDSLNLIFGIVENCCKTEITSINKTYNSKDFDICASTADLCDEIFGNLMQYFNEMFNHGQIIKLKIKSTTKLEEEIKTNNGTQKLFDLINEYIELQCLDKPLIKQQTDFELIYKLKIPMFDSKNRPISASSLGIGLKKYLKSSAKLNSQVTDISKFNIEIAL